MSNQDIETLNKMLMKAYIELCRAEKLLKGSEEHGKRTEDSNRQTKKV